MGSLAGAIEIHKKRHAQAASLSVDAEAPRHAATALAQIQLGYSRPMTRREEGALGFSVAEEFVLRTPLLAHTVLDAWALGTEIGSAPDERLDDAVARDRELLRARLRELVARAEVREAIYLASPTLDASLDEWLHARDVTTTHKVERGIVRYLLRMATRPTPFGLFAGNTVGRIGDSTHLRLFARREYRRHTRLDAEYLANLLSALLQTRAVRDATKYYGNSSTYTICDRLHYVFCEVGDRRRHSLCRVEPTDALLSTLARAADGATPVELAQALSDSDPDISAADAAEFVQELIDVQLLVPELELTITGGAAIDTIIDQLRATAVDMAQETATILENVRTQLSELDRRLANPRDAYSSVLRQLEALPPKTQESRTFQVDLAPVGTLKLERDIAEDVLAAVALLARIGPPPVDFLSHFREAFRARYGDREVPLTEVLDEEHGIGVSGPDSGSYDFSPLLEALPFPRQNGPQRPPPPYTEMLLRRIAESVARDERELVLREADFGEALEPEALPDTMSVMVKLAQVNGDVVACFDAVIGPPPGVSVLGRFCHCDPEILEIVQKQIARDQRVAPNAIFAEIVHHPEDWHANVLHRPVLRTHEIPFLARSGAPRSHQIPITDLLVSVIANRVTLRSSSRGCEVIPRLTTAHNLNGNQLGLYRFLGHLQFQGVQVPWFDLGAAELLPYIPQIRYGRTIIQPARWRLPRAQFASFVAAEGGARVRELRKLRSELRLPRWVSTDDGMVTDLENILAVDNFAAVIRQRETVVLTAIWPVDGEPAVGGDGGSFNSEAILLFHRAPKQLPRVTSRTRDRSAFVPGSEWLYMKLYCGLATVDELITEVGAPWSSDERCWFFVRYGDPDWHVRVRVRCEAPQDVTAILRQLHDFTSRLLRIGRISRLQLDTYDREVHRYGGLEAMALSEQLFFHDSVAVRDILKLSHANASDRWRLAARGVHQLFEDFRIALPRRVAIMSDMRNLATGAKSLDTHVPLTRAVGSRYRELRGQLDAVLDDSLGAPGLEEQLALLRQRSQRIAPIVSKLRALESGERLTVALEGVLATHMHMHVNRMLRSFHQMHEFVIYDFMARHYRSRVARDLFDRCME